MDPQATKPTILVTVGITIQRVTSMLLGELLGLSILELSLELAYLLGKISHMVAPTGGLILLGLL